MKILVISAKFPPDHAGGYGLRLKEICDGLAVRGHLVRMLSTRTKHKLPAAQMASPYPMIRKLHNRHNARSFPKELLFDMLDTRLVEQQIWSFKPDLIYLGHIYPLSKAILPFLARQKIPLILDEGGASLKGAWTEHGRWFRFTGDYGGGNPLIRLVKPLVIKWVCGLSRGRILPEWHWPENLHVIINSHHNLDQLRALGIPLAHATVLHSGIDLVKFSFKPRASIKPPVRIICPGRFERRKGLLDGVHLLEQLITAGIDARLTFAGAVTSKEFMGELLGEIHSAGLEDQVTIHGMLSQAELVAHYQQADICFFPSYQGIGFSRTPLEAMACGCVVIAYGNEGSDEVIAHNKNGYLVVPGKNKLLVNIIYHLFHNPSKYQSIIHLAREQIENNLSLERYLNHVEETILNNC